MEAELIYLVGLDWAEFALRWLHVISNHGSAHHLFHRA